MLLSPYTKSTRWCNITMKRGMDILTREGGQMETDINKSAHRIQAGDADRSIPSIPKLELGTAATVSNLDAPVKIDVRQVNFWHGSKQPLYDVSLPIREKQVTALIGPSVCGKTTFLLRLNPRPSLLPLTPPTRTPP